MYRHWPWGIALLLVLFAPGVRAHADHPWSHQAKGVLVKDDHHDRNHDSGRDREYERLDAIASQIERLADNLKDRAERQEDRGRIGDRELERMRDLKSAAVHFRDQVRKYGADPSHLNEEYDTLADRTQRANSIMGAFSDRYQSDFDQLRDLVRQLNYLSRRSSSDYYDRHY